MKAIVYLRKSTDRQEMSIPDQEKALKKYAATHHIEITKYFKDEGISGKTAIDRPAFMRMINYAKNYANSFDVILVYSVNRWGRFEDPIESLYWEFEVKKYNRKVVFITEDFNNDGTVGSNITNLLKASEASEYSKRLAKDSFRGQKTYAELGYWVGGDAPFGYERALVDENGKIVQILKKGERKALTTQHIKLAINRKEAKVVELIFDLRSNKNMGYGRMANYLNKQGILSSYGKVWCKSSLWGIVHNEAYKGSLVFNKRNYNRNNGNKKYNLKKLWIIAENTHEPIVSKDIWEKAQKGSEVFIGGKHINFTREGKYYTPYLLSKLIVCKKCGNKWQGRKQLSGKKGLQREYICGGYQCKGKHICKYFAIKARSMEDYVINGIQNRLDNTEWRNELKSKLKNKLSGMFSCSNDKSKELRYETNEINGEIDNYKKAIAKGLDMDMAIHEIDIRQKRLKYLLEEKEKTENLLNNGENIDNMSDEMISYLDDFKDTVEKGDYEDRKQFIRVFVKGMTINPDIRTIETYFYRQPQYNKVPLFASGISSSVVSSPLGLLNKNTCLTDRYFYLWLLCGDSNFRH